MRLRANKVGGYSNYAMSPEILKPPGVARTGDAIFVIGVDGVDRGPGVVGNQPDAALPIGAHRALAAAVKPAAFVPRDGVIGL